MKEKLLRLMAVCIMALGFAGLVYRIIFLITSQ